MNIAAVNYHFGSKEKLLEKLLRTRLEPINEQRMELLKQIESKADKNNSSPDLQEIIKKFFDPVMALIEKDEGSKQFTVILRAIFHHPDLKLKKIFLKIVQPVADAYFHCICKALPHLDPQIVLIRVQFAMGVFHHGMDMLHCQSGCHGNKDNVLNIIRGKIPEPSVYKQELIDFMVRGIKGISE